MEDYRDKGLVERLNSALVVGVKAWLNGGVPGLRDPLDLSHIIKRELEASGIITLQELVREAAEKLEALPIGDLPPAHRLFSKGNLSWEQKRDWLLNWCSRARQALKDNGGTNDYQ